MFSLTTQSETKFFYKGYTIMYPGTKRLKRQKETERERESEPRILGAQT